MAGDNLAQEKRVTIEDIENSGVKFEKGEVVVLNTNWTDKTWGKFPDYYVDQLTYFLTLYRYNISGLKPNWRLHTEGTSRTCAS